MSIEVMALFPLVLLLVLSFATPSNPYRPLLKGLVKFSVYPLMAVIAIGVCLKKLIAASIYRLVNECIDA
nr:hypothetical protein BCU62_16085 [Enterovibrio norvegicus]